MRPGQAAPVFQAQEAHQVDVVLASMRPGQAAPVFGTMHLYSQRVSPLQ